MSYKGESKDKGMWWASPMKDPNSLQSREYWRKHQRKRKSNKNNEQTENT